MLSSVSPASINSLYVQISPSSFNNLLVLLPLSEPCDTWPLTSLLCTYPFILPTKKMSNLSHGSYTLHRFFMSYFFNFCYVRKTIYYFYCITFMQVNGCYPFLFPYINRMVCCCFKFFLSINPYMINCMGCCAECFNYFFKTCFSCFFISWINFVTFAYFLYRFITLICRMYICC